MLFIDLTIVGVTALMVVWGYRHGLTVGTLALAGFGAGALIGSQLAPRALEGGLHSPYAPILALPGGLLFGALVATAIERLGLRHRRRLAGLGPATGIGGALLAGCLGLAAAWVLGAAAAQMHSLRDPVRRSAVLKRLNAVLPPPGPLLVAEALPADRLPTLEGPTPRVGRPDRLVVQDPDVRAAVRSVVRVEIAACGEGGVGSGWIAADGIVATAAHVVAGEEPAITVQIAGRGKVYDATPIWFDRVNDVALLQTPGLKGVAALPIVRGPKAGASAAIIGFPGGIRKAKIRPARLGGTSDRRPGRIKGSTLGPGFPQDLYGRPVTSFAGNVQPGNSGGPLVDTRGRVLTTAFLKFEDSFSGLGVPNSVVRSALRRAGPPVDTGPCEDSG